MKLELNYDCKTITVKDQTHLKEFIKEVKKLGLDLKEWNIVSDVIFQSYPVYPYWNPNVWTVSTGTTAVSDNLTVSTSNASYDITNIMNPLNQNWSYTN